MHMRYSYGIRYISGRCLFHDELMVGVNNQGDICGASSFYALMANALWVFSIMTDDSDLN